MKYNLTPQEKSNFCVCSALQAILRSHGLEYTQDQIASRLNSSEDGSLIVDSMMEKFMSENSFRYNHFYYNTTPFNEPDTLLREMDSHHGIIGIEMIGIGLHVFLLDEFKDPKLKVIDPKNGDVLNMDIYKLLRGMKDTNTGVFGLIKYIQ